jgi:hypothetical protein
MPASPSIHPSMNRNVELYRAPFDSSLIIGAAYGSVFEIVGKTVHHVPSGLMVESLAQELGEWGECGL